MAGPPLATCSARPPETSIPATASAVVMFPDPQRFAIAGELNGNRRWLYGKGDLLPTRTIGEAYLVEAVWADAVQLRHTRTRKVLRVGTGEVVPESDHRRLEHTALLEAVEYRYVPWTTTAASEPLLVQVQGRCAQLDVDTAPPPAGLSPAASTASARLFDAFGSDQPPRHAGLEGLQIHPTGRDTYEISSADAQMAFAQSRKMLMDAVTSLRPVFSLDEGFSLQVRSSVADGAFGPRGFRVDSPRMAERAGIETGDVILAVNGQAINGFTDLFRLYQQARSDQSISTISLDLQRQGQLVTKTYRIR